MSSLESQILALEEEREEQVRAARRTQAALTRAEVQHEEAVASAHSLKQQLADLQQQLGQKDAAVYELSTRAE